MMNTVTRFQSQLKQFQHKLRIQPQLKFFDVSMRDGLQSIKKNYSLSEKQGMLRDIIHRYNPDSMEIGSIVSSKVMPQMKDSIELYKYAQCVGGSKYYLLVPPVNSCMKKAKENRIRNISLITSASNAFQLKNVKQDLDTTRENIERFLTDHHNFERVKLYMSCINKCPVENKYVKNKDIVNEVLNYCKFSDIKEICLSDTCGTLNYYDFQDIMDDLLDHMGPGRLSLHLHVSDARFDEVNRIILAAIYRGIYRFDVSSLHGVGGCTVTIKGETHGNLTYEQISNCVSTHWK